MFGISRAKSGKLKSQKAKNRPVCWPNKRQSGNIRLTAILAYKKKNWAYKKNFVCPENFLNP
jgi:hypothetical protein